MIQQATIHKLPLLVGCKAFERNQNGQMLIDIISRFVEAEFPHIDDFKLVTAFQKAASGSLNLNSKPLILSTYGQQLSPKVVGEVLKAFIQTQRSKAAEPAFKPKQLEAPSNPIDAQFMYEWTIRLHPGTWQAARISNVWIDIRIFIGAQRSESHCK
jgi:hypothetical protein